MRSVGALYLHVPFCARKCAYCDFASAPSAMGSGAQAAYVDALLAELKALRGTGLLDDVRTAYVGGGTPTQLSRELLERLVDAVGTAAPGICEFTVEANPESLDDGKLALLAASPVTRISMGVQSLDDAELQALGRIHDARRAKGRLRAAIETGLDVSADLMCATPRQSAESWRRTLEELVLLGLAHVSVYPLQLEEGTPLARQDGLEPAYNDPDVQAARMQEAARVLERAGFERYEVASYARPHKQCAHNIAYWTGVGYLGLGVSAASMLDADGYRALRSVCPQLPEAPEGTERVRMSSAQPLGTPLPSSWGELSFDLEFMDGAQLAAEDLMLAARMKRPFSAELIDRAREALGAPALEGALAALKGQGLLDAAFAPTNKGWLLGNQLYGGLWELAPHEVLSAHADGYNPLRTYD